MNTGSSLIECDSHVIIRKKEYLKLVHLEKCKRIRIGPKTVDLTNIIGKPFFTIFETVPDDNDAKLCHLIEISKTYTKRPEERLSFNNFQVSNPSEEVHKLVR